MTPTTALYDYATVAYDAGTGNHLGADRYDDVGHQHDEAVALLAVGPDGWLYVTGDSWGGERRSTTT